MSAGANMRTPAGRGLLEAVISARNTGGCSSAIAAQICLARPTARLNARGQNACAQTEGQTHRTRQLLGKNANAANKRLKPSFAPGASRTQRAQTLGFEDPALRQTMLETTLFQGPHN
jgi:hypothetical protein